MSGPFATDGGPLVTDGGPFVTDDGFIHKLFKAIQSYSTSFALKDILTFVQGKVNGKTQNFFVYPLEKKTFLCIFYRY